MKIKILPLLLVAILVISTLTGCSASPNVGGSTVESSIVNSISSSISTSVTSSQSQAVTVLDTAAAVSVNAITDKLKAEDSDSSWDAATSTQISLNGTTATVTGDGATAQDGTVTITKAGTYVISGKLTQGQILVNATKDDIVRIVLNGAEITAQSNAAIYAAVANKLVIILAEGTTNTVTDVASYTYADSVNEEPNAAIFGKCDLSINGLGSLTVNGQFSHGIATKDDLVIASGNITVNSVSSAIRGKDSVTILDGKFNLTSTAGDGIKSTNDIDADKGWILIKDGEFNISSGNDGIQAYSILQIDAGIFNVTSGGGWPGGSLKRGSHAVNNDGVVADTKPTTESYKGIKSSGVMVINNGTFIVSSYDDAIHANADLTINGGIFTLQSGAKGIHSDTTSTINSGEIDIKNSFEGIESSNINIANGKIKIYSTDDGINLNSASGLLTVSGGEVYVNAGGDGIDSNNNVVMSGGTLYVDGPTTSGDGAIDYQSSFDLSGGILVAAGGGQMQGVSSASAQPSITLYYSTTQKAGSEIILKSADGVTILNYTPQKDYQAVAISTGEMKLNATYTIYSGQTKLCDVTLSSSVTSIDDTGAVAVGRGGQGQGGPGGQRGGNFPTRPSNN